MIISLKKVDPCVRTGKWSR